MSTVQLVKAWSTGGITPNLRRAYVSLNDLAGWFIYSNTTALAAKWTRKWESNGVTGPSGVGDTTQRLTNVAACSVRGAAAANAQSWGVYTAVDGCQILIAYQGASDDILRISYSKGGLFTLAGTTTNQPTATDEVVIMAATSVVNATASLDRVMSIWCLDGDWRCAIFRSGSIINTVGISLVSPLVSTRVVNPIFTPPYVAHRFTALNMSLSGDSYGDSPVSSSAPGTAVGAANFKGVVARVYTDSSRTNRLGGGQLWLPVTGSNYFSSSQTPTFAANKPALQNAEGSPLLPIYWCGERQSQLDGFLGSPIDWWCAYSSSSGVPAVADSFSAWDPADTPGVTTPRTNWLMSLGSAAIWPWCNVAANMEVT
jgi:hypothetical protein